MCYLSEGKLERCQECSNAIFQILLGIVCNVEPARPSYPLIARAAQHRMNEDSLQFPRQDTHIGPHRNSGAQYFLDRAQQLTHQAQPSSSTHDTPANGAKHKRQRTNTDQPHSVGNDAPNEIHQHKRQKIDTDQVPSLRHDGPVEEQSQHRGQGPTPNQTSSLRQGARAHGAAQPGQQTQSQDLLAYSRRDARSDWANGHEQKESHRDSPSASRHRIITDLTGEAEPQGRIPETSQNHTCIEEIDYVPGGMHKLPYPSWEDEMVILPLARQQLMDEDFFENQERELDDIWGPYAKERQALVDFQASELEESWTPDFEEPEILEREVPLQEDIWERSMLEREIGMRYILDEGETWPRESATEADIWTREEGGMLSAANLRRLWRVFTLGASQEERRLETSDESGNFSHIRPSTEGDEVTLDWLDSELFTENEALPAYPPLASQALH